MDKVFRDRLVVIDSCAGREQAVQAERWLKAFLEADARNDRNAMRNVCEQAFPLEKELIPKINREEAERQQCESLIMTVGFQKEPLILSILCLKPRTIVLLHTEGSRTVAWEVENDAQVQALGADFFPLLVTEHDAVENYSVIRDKALPRTRGHTVVDPTAGRKMMVASLALAAFYLRLPMVYLHTEERRGLAVPFMETLKPIRNPFEYFGDTELRLVQEHFNSHFYEAALRTCQSLLHTIRDPSSHAKVSALGELIGVYRDWDAFVHSSVPRKEPLLSTRLREVIDKFHRLGFQNLLPRGVENNLKFLTEVDARWKNKRNIVDEFRLVDIFVSALRRGSEKQGKYDDAVARLYRCLEMCATFRLKQLGLGEVTKPRYGDYAARLGIDHHELVEKFRLHKEKKGRDRTNLPRGNLALDDQMTLLAVADEKIARIYQSMERKSRAEENSLMEKRNRSILAHGTDPATEAYWPQFREKTRVIIESTIGRDTFQQLLSMAMHGPIRIVQSL